MNVNDVNGNIFLTPQSLSPYCAGVCGACVVMLCNIHSEPVFCCVIFTRPKSNHYMFTLSGFSQIFQNPCWDCDGSAPRNLWSTQLGLLGLLRSTDAGPRSRPSQWRCPTRDRWPWPRRASSSWRAASLPPAVAMQYVL